MLVWNDKYLGITCLVISLMLSRSYENEILVLYFCCCVGLSGPTDALEKQFPDVYCVRRIRIIRISEIRIFEFV